MISNLGVEHIEGIGRHYGDLLRRSGMATLRDLRNAEPRHINAATGAGMRRAVSWHGQAWLMMTEMSRHAAEVLVSSGVAITLQQLVNSDPRDIVATIQQAQDNPEARYNKIPDRERFDISLGLVERWRRTASAIHGFNPSDPATTPKAREQVSILFALEKAVDATLGDLPLKSSEDLANLRQQLVDAMHDEVLGFPTDDDVSQVYQIIEEQPLVLADELLKYLGLWPAGDWLRSMARNAAKGVAKFPVPDEQNVRRQLYRDISPAHVRSILSTLLNRSLKTEGVDTLIEFSETLAKSLSDPGLVALGGSEGGLAGFDGKGVTIGLIGLGWDTTHPSFEAVNLTSDDSTIAEPQWSLLDTAVLSQISAKALTTHENNPVPRVGPSGLAPAAHVALLAADWTAPALVSAIDRAVASLGSGNILLVPRTCVGLVRSAGSATLVDLPLLANRDINAALLRAAKAGIVVIVPAGLGGHDLGTGELDDLLAECDASDPGRTVEFAGPGAEAGIGDRLRKCVSAGVLVVGTSSPWSNRASDIVQMPEIDFTVAGGTQLEIPRAKFTAGWHGPYAAAATAAGLAALFIQATNMAEAIIDPRRIGHMLNTFTVPSWADQSDRPLKLRGFMHFLAAAVTGIVSGETPTFLEQATHDLSATTLLTKYTGVPLKNVPEQATTGSAGSRRLTTDSGG